MLRILIAAVAAVTVAAVAPPAAADAPSYDCRYLGSRPNPVTGNWYDGVLVGFIVHADGGSSSVRCYMTVNGVSVVSTTSGRPFQVVSFSATPDDVVRVCANYTSSHGSGTTCVTLGTIGIPPSDVVPNTLEAVLTAVWPIIDPPLCNTLQALAGEYGAFTIDPDDGDVTAGNLSYDCPPYGG